MLMVAKKIAGSVTGQKIEFEGKFITNVASNEKTLKLRLFVMKNINKIFETDWMEQLKVMEQYY